MGNVERAREIRGPANDRVPAEVIKNRQMKAEEEAGSTRTEASLVTILRLARAKKHLWTLAWFSCGGRTRSLAVHGHRPWSGGRGWPTAHACTLSLGCPSRPLSPFRSGCAASVWRVRNGSDLTGKSFTHMVGSTKLEGERVDDLFNLELFLPSGPENERLEKMNCYSAFPSLFRS